VTSFDIVLGQVEDAAEILALQSQNHISNLPIETLPSGFVTTQLSYDTLAQMCAKQGIWVARASNGELVAYACANSWDFYGESPFFDTAKALLPLDWDGRYVKADNSFQYGPVCVTHSFRGQGVLGQLVETIKAHNAPRFEFGITFIDIRNERSLAAHERKLGFRRLALLPYGDVTYRMLSFPLRNGAQVEGGLHS
jgi:GNAT superfamily N-acetyltransferase